MTSQFSWIFYFQNLDLVLVWFKHPVKARPRPLVYRCIWPGYLLVYLFINSCLVVYGWLYPSGMPGWDNLFTRKVRDSTTCLLRESEIKASAWQASRPGLRSPTSSLARLPSPGLAWAYLGGSLLANTNIGRGCSGRAGSHTVGCLSQAIQHHLGCQAQSYACIDRGCLPLPSWPLATVLANPRSRPRVPACLYG